MAIEVFDAGARQRAFKQLKGWSQEDPEIAVTEDNIQIHCAMSALSGGVGKNQFKTLAFTMTKSVAMGREYVTQLRATLPEIPAECVAFQTSDRKRTILDFPVGLDPAKFWVLKNVFRRRVWRIRSF